MLRTAALATLAVLMLAACTSEHRDVGRYRIATVTDGLGGLHCQPRTEFFFLDPSAVAPRYLGTCGSPRFVTEDLHMPGDPACFAVSAGGDSLVYFHRPNLCGAGEKAAQKGGGVHVHSAADGDRFLYRDQDEVTQSWSIDPIGQHAIRVAWVGAKPSRNGAVCPQKLLIHADGSEQPEGSPGTRDSTCGQ